MIIRKLELNDYNKNFINLLSQLTVSPNITQKEFETNFLKLGNNNLHLVIEENNTIIAYGCIIIDFKFYRNSKNVGHIEDIIVDKSKRGQGISKIIFNKLIEYGLEQNCYKFILNCIDDYKKFYGKMGFENKDNTMVKYIA
jgi:glucosamine-phosphate N-acetyltransferase